MGQEPDRIRAEIEQTRADMSETVGALGYKADVKTRAKESIVGVKDRVVGAGSAVGDRTPDSGEVKDKAKTAASVAQENPLGLAIGAVAVGFVAGMLIPSTRVEDEKLGSVADDVKAKVKETGSRSPRARQAGRAGRGADRQGQRPGARAAGQGERPAHGLLAERPARVLRPLMAARTGPRTARSAPYAACKSRRDPVDSLV